MIWYDIIFMFVLYEQRTPKGGDRWKLCHPTKSEARVLSRKSVFYSLAPHTHTHESCKLTLIKLKIKKAAAANVVQ